MKRLLKSILPEKFRRTLREKYVASTVRHVHGPKKLHLSPTEAVVTCVLKNGDFYVDAFVDHYTRLGFKHIFFLDNGSTDRTITLAKKYSNVSICKSHLPIEDFQRVFKKYLAFASADGGWVLDVDIDEFFEYPLSDLMKLDEFVNYMNQHGYTAVMTQMLDVFSDQPLSELSQRKDEDLRNTYKYYDLSDISKVPYLGSELAKEYGARNEIPNKVFSLYYGGIRKTLYGRNVLLTKHSLFRVGHGIEPFLHVHFVAGAKLADISCTLVHYKLTSNAMETAVQNRDKFPGNGKGYSDFIDVIVSRPAYVLKTKNAREYKHVNDLVASEFLLVSDQYRVYAEQRARKQLEVANCK